MIDTPFIFNGVNGLTGSYLTPAILPREVAQLALGAPIDPDHQQSLRALLLRKKAQYGVGEGINPDNLASAGWGIVFPHNLDPAVYDALSPLRDVRQSQAAVHNPKFYREMIGDTGYQPGQAKRDFLSCNGALAGQAADPNNVPYYLLLVGSPADIPYEFQYQLDVEYAVGRLWFETEDGRPDYLAFAQYAKTVRAAEDGTRRPARAVFFGVRNDDDPATNLSATHLVWPLANQLKERLPHWDCEPVLGADATKGRLGELLGGKETAAFLFTASHGMGFPPDDVLQAPHQGALLCNDWPGPERWHGPILPDHYFSADDLGSDSRPGGLIAFHFACYGAGTPDGDDFDYHPELLPFSYAAARPFVSRLFQRLLGHPKGGALAAVGHVDRAWSCSFFDDARLGEQLITFRSTLERILKGERLGWALEYFNQTHAALGTELAAKLLKARRRNYQLDDLELAELWTANNDARNFVIFGDPAVRLRTDSSPTSTETACGS
jgi:hypothetical protein